MNRFPHPVDHDIRDETIVPGVFDVHGIECAWPGASLVYNIAPFSCSMEAVDDRTRSSRSGRGRQPSADANGPSSRADQQQPDHTSLTRRRACEPRAPFPAFFPTLSQCYRPGMVRPKRVSWFHPPGGCAIGDVMSCHQRSGHISG